MKKFMFYTILPLLTAFLVSCSTTQFAKRDNSTKLLVSVRDQQLLLTKDGVPLKSYPISTSKFGLGSQTGSGRTPLGKMEIAKKIGTNAPSGAVFKSRKFTGEVIKPNTPGRDPIVSRILWLSGKEGGNRNTFNRYIYIHGTPEEYRIGTPASYGCIRMKSSDVIDLYSKVGLGSQVNVLRAGLMATPEGRTYARRKSRAKTKRNLAFLWY